MFKASLYRFSSTSAGKKLRKMLQAELAPLKASGTYKSERIIVSSQQSNIAVVPPSAALTGDRSKGVKVLNFCANNYLGLANNPEVIKAAKKTLDTHGFGMASVRFICGTTDIHKKLENEITGFLGTEDTILYPSCFDANGGVFEVLLNEKDVVISDELNHASIIDGIRLCRAERQRYTHLDMKNLEEILKKNQDKRLRLIATDGVFSMDGDVAPLDKIVKLAEKYDANIFVDDSHATGFMGPAGKGTPALFGVTDKIDVINTTLGKALGGASGGASSGMRELVDLQRQRGRPYLFSNTIAPCAVGGCLKVFELLKKTDKPSKKDQLGPLAQLNSNTSLFRTKMAAAGFEISGHQTCPIAPVMIYDAVKAAQFAEKMLKRNIYVIAFSYPVVPKDKARIRVQLSAAHSTKDVQRAIDAFIEVKKEMKM